MSIFITSLNSGSNGNCYYIGNSSEAVLIDAGISCRETVKRMRRLGLDMNKVKAIFISHEHGDHISGAETLSGKYQIPVYITPATLRYSRLRIQAHLIKQFTAYEPVTIGGLSVLAFPKIHDAADPHSFTITGDGIKTGVFTDIGTVCDHVAGNFKQCNAVFLEANYDEDMLEKGKYPAHLKKRISGYHGHLSNRQALDLFLKHRPPFMSRIYLSHLSKENNTPDAALELFAPHAHDIDIVIASRYEEAPVYQIAAISSHTIKSQVIARPKQIALF